MIIYDYLFILTLWHLIQQEYFWNGITLSFIKMLHGTKSNILEDLFFNQLISHSKYIYIVIILINLSFIFFPKITTMFWGLIILTSFILHQLSFSSTVHFFYMISVKVTGLELPGFQHCPFQYGVTLIFALSSKTLHCSKTY